MDIWLLLSMVFVALAIFEYAILLAIRFGKGKDEEIEMYAEENKVRTCYRVDRISLRVFVGAYILAVCAYFVILSHVK